MARALVLPTDRSASTEPQTIPGLPGLWRPGVCYAPEVLGVPEDEIEERIEGSPLVLTDDADEATIEPSFTLEQLLVPSTASRIEAENARVAVGGESAAAGDTAGWVEQARARATAISLGERAPSPHELNQVESLRSKTKAQLESEAEEAGIQRASTMNKDTLIERLSAHYFGGDETPADGAEDLSGDESVPEDETEVTA